MKVLVIEQLIPETSNAYEVIDPDAETLEKLKACHGLMGNAAGNTSEEDELANWASEFLAECEAVEMVPGEPIGAFDLLVITSFLM